MVKRCKELFLGAAQVFLLAFFLILNGIAMGNEQQTWRQDLDSVKRLISAGELDNAVSFWEKQASKYANKDGNYESLLGHFLIDAGRIDEAERALLRALELGWRGPGLPVNLSVVYRRKHDFPRATYWAERAIREFPEVPWGYSALADVLFSERRWEEAKRLTEKEIELGGNHLAFRRLGHVQMMLGEYQQAIQSLGRAMELEPIYKGDIIVAFLYADANLKLGNMLVARDVILELWRRNPSAKNHEKVVALMGKVEEKLRAKKQ